MLEEKYWMTVYNKLDLIIRFLVDNQKEGRERKEDKG
jgi:hypothetical protein